MSVPCGTVLGMKKAKSTFVCVECGWESAKWLGQCRQCQAWGTIEEQESGAPGSATAAVKAPASAALPVTEVDVARAEALPSGIAEFDRVLGRGVTPGAVILLAGEPGIGKSTLLLDIAARYSRMSASRDAGPVLYASGEESAEQIRVRADRIGALTPELLLAAENDLGTILGHIAASKPSMVIVDSVQTVSLAGVEGATGGVNQIKSVTSALIQVAKERNIPVILVGHVTKDGALAGPRTLEHLVDVVCNFEGDRYTSLRLLRAMKNRFGATEEVGCFQMTDSGMEEISDPSRIFMSPYEDNVPGTCVAMTMQGNRPLPTEIQALVSEGGGGFGKRTVSGIEPARVGMILAVIGELYRSRKSRINLREADIYVSTVGGARAWEPATDLATALALASTLRKHPLPSGLIAVGELGLTGDIRGCSNLGRRINEAARLGFRKAIVPEVQAGELGKYVGQCKIIPVRNLTAAEMMALS